MNEVTQLGVALAQRGQEIRNLRSKVETIDRQPSVFGPNGQPSAYLVSNQATLRVERERLVAEIGKLEALEGRELQEHYTPKPVPAVTQQAGFDPALNAVLSNGAQGPAGFVPGKEYTGAR